MEIEEVDDREGQIYRIKKIEEMQKISIAERINETNFVHNITEELILLV